MLHVALYEPEIPPNTGNIARLCAATATRLHLIGRLGFHLDDRSLKRAGCDYWPKVDVWVHATWDNFLSSASRGGIGRIVCVETPAEKRYTQWHYQDGDCLLFGSESRGLPPSIREQYRDAIVGIPMPTGNVRSINLATAVGIVLYEALRQLHHW